MPLRKKSKYKTPRVPHIVRGILAAAAGFLLTVLSLAVLSGKTGAEGRLFQTVPFLFLLLGVTLIRLGFDYLYCMLIHKKSK